MELTVENYFSQNAQMEYMSVSQFKAFETCEAAALAEVKGEWIRPKTTSLLVGSYVDSYFEGSIELFKKNNTEIFTKQGELRSEYRKAEEIIRRIESDEGFMKALDGKKQVIKTGVIEGIPVKIKMDVLHIDSIIDIKVMKDFKDMWKDGQKVPWFIGWGYDLQGAVYQAIEGNKKPFKLVAATKESVIDVLGVNMSQELMNERLGYFKCMINHYDDIKKGRIEPIRCEKCDYCKSTKKFKFVDAMQLIYEME